MNRVFLLGFLLIPFICFAKERVEIKREIVTNQISPFYNSCYGFINLTNSICFTATNYIMGGYYFDTDRYKDLEKERDELRKQVNELTYPKKWNETWWVWSNTIYTVFEDDKQSSQWTNQVCIQKINRDFLVKRYIRTNKTEKLESVNIDTNGSYKIGN